MASALRMMRQAFVAVACGVAIGWTAVLTGIAQQPAAATGAPALTCEEMENFLRTAKVVSQKELSVGVTLPSRATLDDGHMRHDASIQTIDVSKHVQELSRSTELNFRDTWKFNIAGYELAKMLQLNMVPPYVERTIAGKSASVSWWIDDAMMNRERYLKKIEPPDPAKWNFEIYATRIFHQLIYDTDPNLTNMLITKDWRLWMIDFSRAFRWMKELQKPKELVRADRRLLERLRGLTREGLQEKLGRWLVKPEIDGVIARRDLLLKHFETEVAKRGEAAVLYDLPRTNETCGTGLR